MAGAHARFVQSPVRCHLDRLGSSFGSVHLGSRSASSSETSAGQRLAAVISRRRLASLDRRRARDFTDSLAHRTVRGAVFELVSRRCQRRSYPEARRRENSASSFLTDGTTVYVPQADVVSDERVALAGSKARQRRRHRLRVVRSHEPRHDRHPGKDRADRARPRASCSARSPGFRRSIRRASTSPSPDATLYLDDTAADDGVGRVSTKPGLNSRPDEVRGITQLVAVAVDGLKPENVTIVNQDGNVLVPRAAPGSNVAEQQAPTR